MNLEMPVARQLCCFPKRAEVDHNILKAQTSSKIPVRFWRVKTASQGRNHGMERFGATPLKLTAKASENRLLPPEENDCIPTESIFRWRLLSVRGRVAVSDICFLWTYDWCHITQRRSNTFKRCFSLWKFVFVSSHSFCWLETAGCWWKITLSLP